MATAQTNRSYRSCKTPAGAPVGITQVAAIAAMVGRLRHLRRPHSSLIVRGWQQWTRKLVGGSLRREHPRVLHFPHTPPTTPATCKPHKLPSLPASCREEWAPPTQVAPFDLHSYSEDPNTSKWLTKGNNLLI